MARTLLFRMVFRKFSEIAKNKPIFSQYNIFYNYEYFFFQSAFWSLFNHRQRSQSNLSCFGVHSLRSVTMLFSIRKLKEIRVLRSVFPDYVISCDYAYIKWFVWYSLYDSQSAFKFLWRLHYHANCSYQLHKSCSYRLFRLHEFKQND